MNDMNYTYDFIIAGLLLRVNSQYSLTNFFELSDFRIAYKANKMPDAQYSIEPLPENWTVRGTILSKDSHSAVYSWQGALHHYFFWNVYSQDRYILVAKPSVQSREHKIYLQKDTLDQVLPQFRLAAFLSPQHLLLNNCGFFLHASLVEWQGQGILFTGPSGIGKSMQANLWAQYEGGKILNGDKVIVRYLDGQWLACGSPYAGTSGIYTNRSVPIRAIVTLSQAQENTLQQFSPSNALRKLLQEVIVLPWDPLFINRITELLLDVINEIPVYHLACLPNASAVELLKQTLCE